MSPQARLGGGTVCWAGKGAGLVVPYDHPEKASVPYDCGAGRTKASLVVLVVKNPPANSGDKRDPGSIPSSGRSPEEGNSNHSSIPAWRIPWTEEPGKLQPMGSQSRTQLKRLSLHTLSQNEDNGLKTRQFGP